MELNQSVIKDIKRSAREEYLKTGDSELKNAYLMLSETASRIDKLMEERKGDKKKDWSITYIASRIVYRGARSHNE